MPYASFRTATCHALSSNPRLRIVWGTIVIRALYRTHLKSNQVSYHCSRRRSSEDLPINRECENGHREVRTTLKEYVRYETICTALPLCKIRQNQIICLMVEFKRTYRRGRKAGTEPDQWIEAQQHAHLATGMLHLTSSARG